MLRATVKSLFARKLRLGLSTLAVVLGVAFVAGTLILTDTLDKSFTTLFSNISANTAVSVRAPSPVDASDDGTGGTRPPLPASVLPTLEAVPGVRSVAANVEGYAQIIDRDGKAVGGNGPPTLAEAWSDSPAAALELVDGTAPTGPDDVVIDASVAKKTGYVTGDSIPIATQDGVATFHLAGVAKIAGADNVGGATLSFFTVPTAQRLTGHPDQFTSFDLEADAGVSQQELQQRVSSVLPAGAEAITGKELIKENQDDIRSLLSFLDTFLLVFAGISLFVGAFVILNTFTILIAQRTREMALLRAVGASRGQVNRSVLLESVIVGVIGATVGLVAGIVLSLGLRALFGATGADLPSTGLVVEARTVIVSYVVGIGVVVLAAVVPAFRASRVPPVAALRDSADTGLKGLGRRAVVGAGITVLGIVLLALGLAGGSIAGVAVGVVLTFVGVIALSPSISRPVTGALGAPGARLFGVSGRLSRQNAQRNPRRTSATAGALMIGLALVSLFAVFASSLKSSVRTVVTSSLGADFVVYSQDGPGLGPDLTDQLRQQPGVASASGIRQSTWEVDGDKAGVTGVEPDALRKALALQKVSGDLDSLSRGDMLVSDKVLKDKGWSVGQQVSTLTNKGGDATMTIGGAYKDNQLAGSYLINMDVFSRSFAEQTNTAVLIVLGPDSDAGTVRSEITSVVGDNPTIKVQDQSEFIQQAVDNINTVLNIVYVLLALAIVIALFGIVNTLALSVIERTREIGLLRAVGMGRRSIRAMIRLEAVVISVYGALLGIVVGVGFAWALVTSLHDEGITEFSLPWGTLVAFLVLAGVAGVVAAIWPARRAARMNVLDAIATT